MSAIALPTHLQGWLDYVEGLHRKPIELGLDRARLVLDRLSLTLPGVKFVVGGTNGKGSTCAMLEAILIAAGYRVGCYTSPHLLKFNERLRLDGVDVTDDTLLPHFERVELARLRAPEVSLTYFEFTTLVFFSLMAEQPLDAVILEVGLGGRLDAVNLVDADVSIVTSVDLDHQDFLGDTREAIGFEKAHIYRAGRPAICADPVPPASLLKVAADIGADLWLFGRDFNYQGDKQQWSWAGRGFRRNAMGFPALRGANQLLNASGALAALAAVSQRLPVAQQAVRVGLAHVEVPGRFQVMAGRPTTVLDVAHNPHAASVLAANLEQMGFFPFTHAVLGMLADKDIDEVIRRLGKKIDHWYLADLPGPRGARSEHLEAAIRAHGFVEDAEHSLQCFASASAAWQAASNKAGENDRIIVFGSFLTVADVLEAIAAQRQRSS